MNRGAFDTSRAIRERGLSINKAAALVDSDPGTFSKILREIDGRKPGRALATRILAEFGTALELWEQPVEHEAFEPETAAEAPNPTGTES